MQALFTIASSLLVVSKLPAIFAQSSAICGQFDSIVDGPFTLFNDQFGSGSAISGSQCAEILSLSEDTKTVSWSTNWTWVNGASGGGVKSFANINLNEGVGVQLSKISSIPTSWDWSYDITSTSVADVAYDTFTADTADPNAPNVNEIMVWLANINAGPISSAFNAQGQAVPVSSNINLESHTWNLFSGSNGANQVFSFLPTEGEIMSFSGDINSFFQFLIQNGDIEETQFLKTVQGGTEATSGTGTLTVSQFSVMIN